MFPVQSPWLTALTPVECPPPPFSAGPQTRFFLLGSCFSDHLGEALTRAGLQTFRNPLGQLYSPLVLAEVLDLLGGENDLDWNETFEHQGLWSHPLAHPALSRPSRQAFADHLEPILGSARQALRQTDILVLTLGTAWTWKAADNGRIWANCHRLPAQRFTLDSGSVEAGTARLGESLARLQARLPGLNVVLTVSPVRHWRQGAAENSLSKAMLRLICNNLTKGGPFENRRWYFPAFELVLDELRDYRWFKADGLHPSDEAGRYVAERFLEAAASDRLKAWLPRAAEIRRRQDHRHQRPESTAALSFQARTQELAGQLLADFPEAAPGSWTDQK